MLLRLLGAHLQAEAFIHKFPDRSRHDDLDAIEVRLGDVRIVLPLSITNERIAELVVALERRVESTR